VTVVNVSMQKEKMGKHTKINVIVVQFDAALATASAQNLAAYSLVTMATGKKHPSKPVALVQSSYNPTAHTVTLTPRKALVLSPPLQLRIDASALTDTLGRPVAGNSAGDVVANLSKGGVSVSSAVRFERVKRHPQA
jgi:hypothetical protein